MILKFLGIDVGDIAEMVKTLRMRVWNKRILLWWYRLWIRKNEFHRSLDLDMDAMLVMNHAELQLYMSNLSKRREIAHRRDLAH